MAATITSLLQRSPMGKNSKYACLKNKILKQFL